MASRAPRPLGGDDVSLALVAVERVGVRLGGAGCVAAERQHLAEVEAGVALVVEEVGLARDLDCFAGEPTICDVPGEPVPPAGRVGGDRNALGVG